MLPTSQAGWAVLIVYRPNRTLLLVGAVANAATIILWTLTRTGGPCRTPALAPQAVGTLELISTLLELAIVLGAAALLAQRTTLAASDTVTQRLETICAHHPTFARDHNKLAS
jgi:hypothetical protein